MSSPNFTENLIDKDTAKIYCWRKNLIGKFESLWSLLHKFALLNAANCLDMRRIFVTDTFQQVSTSSYKWQNRSNLRFFEVLSVGTLEDIFQTDNKYIAQSVVSTFLRENEADWMSCNVLRFCPLCLQTGYHSTLHQLLVVTKCPIHRKTLQTQCFRCDREISYQFDKTAFKKPYCCSNCELALSPKLLEIGYSPVFEWTNNTAMIALADWLIKRAENTALNCKLSNKVNQDSIEERTLLTNKLMFYWSDIIKTKNQLKSTLKINPEAFQNIRYTRITISVQIYKEEKTDLFGRGWDRELYSIFKSIARHLKKTQLRKHISCIENYGRTAYWDNDTISVKGKICALANAYILWRIFLEGLNSPANLFKKFKTKAVNSYKVDWTPPSYRHPNIILKRIFVLDCYSLFEECKILARNFYDQNIYSFNTSYILGNDKLYWIVDPISNAKNKEQYGLHYWFTKPMKFTGTDMCKYNKCN